MTNIVTFNISEFISFKDSLLLLIMCLHVYLCLVCAHECRSPWRSEEGLELLGTGVYGKVWDDVHECWELNSDPLQEQQSLLTSKPFLQLLGLFLKTIFMLLCAVQLLSLTTGYFAKSREAQKE